MNKRVLCLLIVFGLLAVVPVVWGQDGGGQVIKGTINNDVPFVRVPVTIPTDGSTFTADIKPISGDLDTLLYLVDSDGQIVAENDDRSKNDPSSLIEFPQADAGDYTLIVTRYKVAEGDSSGDFELNIRQDQATTMPTYRTDPASIQAAGYPDITPRDHAMWTILVYYGGDNNLEPGILNDLDEFEVAGGSTDNVRVVALVDRNPRYTDSNGNWDTVRLFEVGADVSRDHPTVFPPTIDTPALADLGELDTADGETLAQFLVWAIRHYPADHYAVAFGSHGAGWQGLIQDDTSDSDLLTLPELQQAFAIATNEAGVGKFDLLINDACLMSSIEYFTAMSPYFHYSLASPEIVVDPALDMTSLMSMIENPYDSTDMMFIGSSLVDLYITRDILLRASSDAVYLTHSVTNLDKFDPVTAAVEHFAQVVNRNPSIYSTLLGEARANTYTYTNFLAGNTKIDLGNFMRRVIAGTTDDALINASEDVLTAVNDARVYGNAGERVVKRTSYYNIYFPDSSKDFKLSYFEQSPLSQWGKMLRNYYNAVTPQVWTGGGLELGFHLPVAPKIAITSVYPGPDINLLTRVDLSLEIVGRRISYGDFTVDQIQPDGSAIRLSTERILEDSIVDDELIRINSWRPGVELSSYFWDVTLPVVSDGTMSHNELLISTEDVAFLDGRYREPGSDVWNDVGVIFSLDGVMQRIVNRSPDSDALAVVTIAPGSEFQAYSSVVTPDGRVVSEPGNAYIWPENGLTWAWHPAPDGQYYLGFLLTAFGGTTGFDSTTVTVNNTGIDPALRGETRLDIGFNLARPADWTRLAYFPDTGYLRTSSPDDSENLTVYFSIVKYDGSDFEVIPEGFLSSYGRTRTTASTPVDVNGTQAVQFDYTYETDAGTVDGRALATFNPYIGIGVVYTAEALQGTGDLDATFDMLQYHLTLIDLAALAQSDTAEWDVVHIADNAGMRADYPVRFDWEPGVVGDVWERYTPGADPNSPTFAAEARVEVTTDDVAALLSQYVTDYVVPGTTTFTLTETRTYYAQKHTWNTALYTAERNGQPVVGRMYAMIVNGAAYFMWQETPNDDTAAAMFADVLEFMLDGFLVVPDNPAG